jgi:hypothetical protein
MQQVRQDAAELRAGGGSEDMRRDPDGVNLNVKRVPGFGYFGPRKRSSHWTASLLSKGPKWNAPQRVDFSSLVSSPRWHNVIIP